MGHHAWAKPAKDFRGSSNPSACWALCVTWINIMPQLELYNYFSSEYRHYCDEQSTNSFWSSTNLRDVFYYLSIFLNQGVLKNLVFQVVLGVKNLPANAGDVKDTGPIPGLGRSPGGGRGNPLQYSCLENPMDRGPWWATVHRVQSRTRLKGLGSILKTGSSSQGQSWLWH